MKILAIDPGNVQSAFVLMDDEDRILDKGILENERMEDYIVSPLFNYDKGVIEMIACYGMPVGATVFDTVVWVGRFFEIMKATNEKELEFAYRRDIKLHLCNSVRAKDSNVRQALIDRFGEPGTKKHPGKLYGFKKDMWAALAVGVYYLDKLKRKT